MPAFLQHSVGSPFGPPAVRPFSRCGRAQNSSGNVDRPHDNVQKLERPGLVKTMGMALGPFRPINAYRPKRERDAIDGDGTADVGCLAEFPGDPPEGRGGNSRDLFRLLRRIFGDMLLEKLEGGTATLPSSGDCRITECWIVIGFDLLIRRIVNQWLIGAGLTAVPAVRSCKIRRIGFVFKKIDIISNK